MDILRGYSKAHIKKFGHFYFSHLNLFTSEDIDEKKLEYENHAKTRGVPTEEEKLEQLKEDDLWSDARSDEIKDSQSVIKSLMVTKTKFVLKADIDNIQKQIEDEEKKLIEALNKKEELLGYTVETYAVKKINEFFIYSTSFIDKELKTKLFTEEDFEELHEQDVQSLVLEYNNVTSCFGDKNMKRIALSGFFLNSFYMCKDNPFTFYGKPVVHLSFNQNELFSLGRYFKNILSELKHDPAPEVMDDPDKLIEMFNVSKNSEKIKEKMSESDATSVVGATKEDLERMGIVSPHEDGAVSLSKAAAEKGGSLEMEDLMKLHGL